MKSKKTLTEIFSVKALIFILILSIAAFLLLFLSKEKPTNGQVFLNQVTDNSTIKARINNEDFEIDIAKSLSKRRSGLMFVNELPKNRGMLFVSETSQIQNFYMKNTLISLDIIFLNENFEVMQFYENTKVNQTDEYYISDEPANYVLELNAGSVEEFGIKVGDKVEVLSVE